MIYLNIVLLSLKNNEKIFTNVVCCSRDWRFNGQHLGRPKSGKSLKTENRYKRIFSRLVINVGLCAYIESYKVLQLQRVRGVLYTVELQWLEH